MSPLTSGVIGAREPDLRELPSGPQIDVPVARRRRLRVAPPALLALLRAPLALGVALDGSERGGALHRVHDARAPGVDRVQRLGHERSVADHWASASASAARCALSWAFTRSAAATCASRMRSL